MWSAEKCHYSSKHVQKVIASRNNFQAIFIKLFEKIISYHNKQAKPERTVRCHGLTFAAYVCGESRKQIDSNRLCANFNNKKLNSIKRTSRYVYEFAKSISHQSICRAHQQSALQKKTRKHYFRRVSKFVCYLIGRSVVFFYVLPLSVGKLQLCAYNKQIHKNIFAHKSGGQSNSSLLHINLISHTIFFRFSFHFNLNKQKCSLPLIYLPFVSDAFGESAAFFHPFCRSHRK